MNFYKIVLTQMILWVVSTFFEGKWAHCSRSCSTFHIALWEKWVFATSLQLNFWIALNISNSFYLYIVNVNIYMVQFIVTRLQLSQNNSCSTIMQFCCNYTADVMLTSLIVIYLLKSNTWYYEDIWT
jgi:hypothetical protein